MGKILTKGFLIAISYIVCTLIMFILPDESGIVIYYIGLAWIGTQIYKINKKILEIIKCKIK